MKGIKSFLFKNTSIRQTILKNTFWIGGSTALIKIARAAIIIYAARLIGTESYGLFTYAMGLAAIFAVVSDVGISSILVRELSKDTERVREYFSTGFVIKLGLLGIMIALILGIAPNISNFPAATLLMPVIALSIAFDSLRSFLYSIPRSQNKMQNEAVIGIITEICSIALILIMFLHNPSAATLAYALMIGNVIGLIVAIISVRRYLIGAHRFFTKSLVSPLIKLTFPFAVLSIFGVFMTNIDSIIIGIFGTEHMLGLYGAAQRPFNIFNAIPGFLALSLLPMLSKLIKEKKSETVSALTNTAGAASFSIGAPLALGGLAVAGPLMSVIFGPSYIDALPTFKILLLTILFVFPGTIYAELLLAQNKQKIFIFTGIIGMVLNITLDLILIPSYGIIGSAIATLVAQVAVNIAFYIEARKSYSLTLIPNIYKSLIAGGCMAVVAYFLTTLSWPLILIIILSAVLYIGLLVLMKDRLITEIRRSFR